MGMSKKHAPFTCVLLDMYDVCESSVYDSNNNLGQCSDDHISILTCMSLLLYFLC